VIVEDADPYGVRHSIDRAPGIQLALPLPPGLDAAPDLNVLLFAAGVTIASGIGAGLAPARFGARGDVLSALKIQGAGRERRRSRLRVSFVGVQAAASMFLLIAAGLLTRSAVHLSGMALGFEADKLLAVSLEIPRTPANYDRKAERYNDNTLAYLRSAIAEVRAIPSVEDASLAMYAFGFSPMDDASVLERRALVPSVPGTGRRRVVCDGGLPDRAGPRLHRG